MLSAVAGSAVLTGTLVVSLGSERNPLGICTPETPEEHGPLAAAAPVTQQEESPYSARSFVGILPEECLRPECNGWICLLFNALQQPPCLPPPIHRYDCCVFPSKENW